MEVKQRCTPADPSINRGYAARGTEALSYSIGLDAPPDLFEAFNIGEDDVDYDDPFYARRATRCVRPQHLARRIRTDLRPALVDYFSSARNVGTDVDRGVRRRPRSSRWLVLAISSTARPRRCEPFATNVGPAKSDPLPGQQRMGAHTDYGIVTVLYAEPVAGLQIVAPDGDWIDVIPADDALVINLGDLTAQWTNDQWRSTVHRVVPPPSDRRPGRASQRGVLPRRQLGRGDRVPADLHQRDNPPRYAPVTAGEHLMAKLMGPRLLRASDAVDTSGDRGR